MEKPSSSAAASPYTIIVRRAAAIRRWVIMRKWNAIQPVVTELNHVAMRQKILQRAHEAQEAGTVRTTLSKEELALVPFWQQGDVSLETSEALVARCRLRKAPAVVEELQRWWSTAQRSVQSGVDAAASTVAREDYIRISRLLSKAMLPDFDADEAQRAAEEDWEDDSAGSPSLSRERFMDCIFELADVWTEHISEGEYVRFLSGLFERIAFAGPWTPSGSTWFWRHEKDVEYTDEPEPEPLPEATDEGSEVHRTRIEEQKTEGQTEEQRRIERPKSFRRMIPPEISVPEISVPEISVPEISVPEISVREIPVREPELLSLSRDDDAKIMAFFRAPDTAVFEGKSVALYTFEQLSQQPRLKLKNRAMDLRDLVGADRLPALTTTGSIEAVTRWIMDTQCALCRASGLGDLTPEMFGMPADYGAIEDGGLLHPTSKTMGRPRQPMQDLVQGNPSEAIAVYEAATAAAAATRARNQSSNIFG
ncbi:sporangia induced hypothetical protein [Chrysochromulina tobinii]|uniref:Uncharacterized protein n=1 Tax=Chrysochromulina tobinii TaxID=1460289 RepID=A0A0M0JQX2_9EUKA|nr:sporangia induced hypothetical protein [Chrysochromulina tobinii]|eukprot:KOO28984.1 sporangia induced hypothetical protein [Chrysochromulina sp. CCMP291]